MWMYLEGKIAITSSNTFSKKVKVLADGTKISSKTPQVCCTCFPFLLPAHGVLSLIKVSRSGKQLNSGYDAIAAEACPGNSISGITVMYFAAAYLTISLASSCV